ncbi:MAG: hypothetical protein PHU85_12360, partial [Phycisphaerae bacterium]|nr:hypothetical protein [Phycisphaerae bacterium]
MLTAVIHPGAIGDLVLALPLVQTLARTSGPVELVAAGDRAAALARRGAVSAGWCIDGLPLAELFVPGRTTAEISLRLAEWLDRFDCVVSAYPSETFTANLRRICRGRVGAVNVQPAAIEASGLHASDFIHRQMFDSPTPLPH